MSRTAVALALCCSAAVVAGCAAGTSTSLPATPPGSPAAVHPANAVASPTTAAATPSSAPAGPVACSTAHLSLRVGGESGAAGTDYRELLLTNTGSTACTTGGYPGVSFLDASGHQVGLAASRDANVTPRTITLAPGADTGFLLGTPTPGAYQTSTDPASSTCKPATTSRVRVYPPNQTAALTVPFTDTICTDGKGNPHVSALGASL